MKGDGKKIVSTEKAPLAVGPYSQAVSAGGFVFVSGQIALAPGGGRDMVGVTAEMQTDRILMNITAILEEAGTSLDRVVKASIYLKDIHDFTSVNEVYGSYFSKEPPARVTVGVSDLPLGARVMIDMIALK